MGRSGFLKIAYAVESRRDEGGGRSYPVVVAKCANCPATVERRLAPSNHNPENIGKLIRGRGWEFDPFHKAAARCPACQAAARRPNDDHKTGSLTLVASNTRRESAPAPSTVPAVLTNDQRKRVRDLLDATFDERLGQYLDDYSDQRVADECKVPAVRVREIREAAYGELRSVPELDKLRAEYAALAKRASDAAAAAMVLNADVGKFEKRIAEVAARLGVAS